MEFKGTDKTEKDIKVVSSALEAQKIINTFGDNYKEGAGIFFNLAPYSLLRDYQEIFYTLDD